MKLLQCHVDNFGRLSNYDYEFSDGLNVIQEPNGFGKSTLAAFIKAMLYGYPRTGARNIAGNDRKKYLPWQGGTYGGSLDFELEGTCYRVRRTFGKTAAKDTYSLRDLGNRRESTTFSEKLGEELFQLDSDSFMRSVYMPQMQEFNSGATTSIQTKLNNLVDNTDDLNNYDSAMDKLREARSAYRKYRGTGGHIDKVQDEIQTLEIQLTEADVQRDPLEVAIKNVRELKKGKDELEAKLENLRHQITMASDRQARQALRDQFIELEKDLNSVEQDLSRLDEIYRKGYPTKGTVTDQIDTSSLIQRLKKDLGELVLNEDDVQRAEEGRAYFSNEENVETDIRQCQTLYDELVEVAANEVKEMSSEEVEQRELLNQCFEEGVPGEDVLQEYQEEINDLTKAHGEKEALYLGTEELESLNELTRFFEQRKVDESELDCCEEKQREIKNLESKIQDSKLSEEELKKWERLKRMFSIGIPQDEEVQQKQNDCLRINELNGKKETKTVVLKSTQSEKPKKPIVPIVLAVVGAVLIAAAIYFFLWGEVKSSISIGAVLVVGGFVSLMGALLLYTRQMVNRNSEQVAVESSAINEEEIHELYTLQKDVSEFLLRYYEDASKPNDKLVGLLFDKREYEQLKEKTEQIQGFEEQITQKKEFVESIFQKFFDREQYRETFVSDVKERWKEYNRLQNRERTLKSERETLEIDIEQKEKELRATFARYYSEDSRNFTELLMQLKSDIKALQDLNRKWEETKEKRAESAKRKSELNCSIMGTLNQYHVNLDNQNYTDAIEELRNSFALYRSAASRVDDFYTKENDIKKKKAEAEAEQKKFAEKYGFDFPMADNQLSSILEDISDRSVKLNLKKDCVEKMTNFKELHPEFESGLPECQREEEELPSTDELMQKENQVKDNLKTVNARFQVEKETRDRLRSVVEQIPEMEDQVSRLKVELKNDENSCNILDTTMSLLETAKNNLSNQYVGSVEKSFATYIQELMGNKFKNALLNQDLTVQVDAGGEAREIGYFSAGTIDSIMLCMRLALIDALFQQEKPFLLLDDPFINLDDEHTTSVLEIMHRIAEEHQVIYMVCNSSRV